MIRLFSRWRFAFAWLLACSLYLPAVHAGAVSQHKDQAQVAASVAAQNSRPKIGLALSGGGARGAAHIGVLRFLEEMHIPVDYIAGTSMGSIIGGLYASGMTPDEIELGLKSMDWEHIFDDSPPRKDRSYRRKRDDDLYLVKAKLGISDDGEVLFPTGAIQGQKFDLALRELTLPVTTTGNFDQLYIPFRAVASDIGSGRKVVLASGDLAMALRASMAVPGIFAATEIDGHLLVDGGITDNLPVDVVREMGADIVIAIDIGTPNMAADQVDNLFKITSQLISIMTRTNVEEQIASLTEQDVLIVPDLQGFSSTDFVNATSIVPAGYAAAVSQRDELARLALPESAYEQHLAARIARPERTLLPVIEFVRVENDSALGDGMIRDRLRQGLGQPLDRQQLEEDLSRIYGLEVFRTVHYNVIEEDGKQGLLIDASARSWGPNYLQLGMELANDQEGNNRYDLGLAYLRTGINSRGGEIRLALQVGENPLVGAEWHQPLDSLSRYFVRGLTTYQENNVSLYDGRGKDRLADFRVSQAKIDVTAGREFGVFGEARVGYRYRTGDVDLESGVFDSGDFSYSTGEIYGHIAVDRLDNFNFPGDGWLAIMEYDVAREDYGGDEDFEQLQVRANTFSTFGDGHVFGLGGLVSSTIDDAAPIQDRFTLGGFLNLSGFAEDSLSGQQAGVVTAVYYRSFTALPFLSWYLGGSLEYGGVWEDKSDLFNDGITSGSVFLGADTPLGPMYLGYGNAEDGFHSIFFYLGRPRF